MSQGGDALAAAAAAVDAAAAAAATSQPRLVRIKKCFFFFK